MIKKILSKSLIESEIKVGEGVRVSPFIRTDLTEHASRARFRKVSKKVSKEYYPDRNYREAEIYAARDSHGELVSRPRWYIYFFILHDGKWIMRKKTDGINRIKNLRQRLVAAGRLKAAINNMLARGYNEFNELDETRTLQACVDEYLQVHVSKLKSRTYTTMKSTLNQFTGCSKFIKKTIPVSHITSEHIRSALDFLYKKNKWENRQFNNSLRRWRTFFNYLVQKEKILRNPTLNIPLLKVYPTDQFRPPNEEEFSRIVNHLYKTDTQLFLYAMIIYYEGFRVTETGILKRSQIEFSSENPFFRLAARNQKDNEDIIQYISPHLLEYFYQFAIDKLPADYYLFSKKLLPGPVEMSKIKEIAEKRWKELVIDGLKIKVKLYSMKHKQATELGHKASTKDISNFMRHSSEAVTRLYMKKYRPQVSIKFFNNQRPLPIKEK